jgi:hypothetical protein
VKDFLLRKDKTSDEEMDLFTETWHLCNLCPWKECRDPQTVGLRKEILAPQ